MQRIREILFSFLALGAALAAVYHLAGALGLIGSSETPLWRHILFIGIDILLAWYLLKRPRWGLLLVALLVAQQTWGHGGKLIAQWHDLGTVHWISAVTLVGLYLALALLIQDVRAESRKTGKTP